MRYDEKLYLKVKSEAEKWLFQIPRVYGIALGPKIVDGRLTKEIAIQVFVKSKLPIDELPAAEVIPRKIKGIKTETMTPHSNCLTWTPAVSRLTRAMGSGSKCAARIDHAAVLAEELPAPTRAIQCSLLPLHLMAYSRVSGSESAP